MTAPDPALTRALDDLATQVNPDNVLAVHKVFRDQAEALQRELIRQSKAARVGLCVGDPVSVDATVAFNAKIDQLLEVHHAHQRELVVAADHLKKIAKSYGMTESEIEISLRSEPG